MGSGGAGPGWCDVSGRCACSGGDVGMGVVPSLRKGVGNLSIYMCAVTRMMVEVRSALVVSTAASRCPGAPAFAMVP